MNYGNAWLENTEEIRNKSFHDMYYFETLCFKISSFLKNAPVPVCCKYSSIHKSFSFHIGENYKFIKVDTDVSYMDFITLLKTWVKDFYPRYEIDKKIELPEKEEVIRQKIKGGMPMSEAFNLTRTETYKEIGVIEKILILDDTFILKHNENRELRMAGSIKKPLSLSVFMKNIRSYRCLSAEEKNEKIYDYILDNSRIIKQFPMGKKEVPISYSGKQMLNFFKINFDDLKEESLTSIDNFNYAWGKFTIKFENASLKDDCIKYYEKRKNESI